MLVPVSFFIDGVWIAPSCSYTGSAKECAVYSLKPMETVNKAPNAVYKDEKDKLARQAQQIFNQKR